MDTLIHEITLGFSNETGILNIPVSQHDINRIISIRFTNYGEEYEIPEGTIVFLKAKKPDGTEINTDEFCSIADNKVQLQIFEQLSAVSGIVPCEIILSNENGTKYTSNHFNLIVNRSVHNDDNLRSSDTYKNLVDIIVELNNLNASEKMRTENENQRIINEQKRENMFSNVLDNAKSYSDNAQNSSDSAKESKESAANNALESENWARRAKEEADRAYIIAGFSGSYNDLSDKPEIPTKTSQLTNDSGFKTTDNDTWKANTSSTEGYVAKGSGHVNKVWGTDAGGNPGWRDKEKVSLTNNLLANQPGTALDAAQAPVIVGRIDAIDNKVATINSTLKKLTGYVTTTVLENDYIHANYIKNGNVVEIQFSRNKIELKANTEYILGCLREDCWPPRSVMSMIALSRPVSVMAYLTVDARTGEVRIFPYSDLPASSYTYYNFVFSCR